MSDRLEVLKTYKTYVGGAFPRTESGRYYKVSDKKGQILANACRCSRKDVRKAVVAARQAFGGWSSRTAYNRGQILYRMAEMLETRKGQFIDELQSLGYKAKAANSEVAATVDRLIYYAGWADKFQQVFGSINPVASAHFNFSVPKPTGVVTIIAPEGPPLLGLITMMAPVIVGGNSCVILASERYPLSALNFAEVLHSSDLPGGVVNILTGYPDELLPSMTSHMDVNAVWYHNSAVNPDKKKLIGENAALNIKHISQKTDLSWDNEEAESPYLITEFQEIKTTWHPTGY